MSETLPNLPVIHNNTNAWVATLSYLGRSLTNISERSQPAQIRFLDNGAIIALNGAFIQLSFNEIEERCYSRIELSSMAILPREPGNITKPELDLFSSSPFLYELAIRDHARGERTLYYGQPGTDPIVLFFSEIPQSGHGMDFKIALADLVQGWNNLETSLNIIRQRTAGMAVVRSSPGMNEVMRDTQPSPQTFRLFQPSVP